MTSLRSRLYLSTLCDDAPRLAQAHGLGLELVEFCTAVNLDENFDHWDALASRRMAHASRWILHAPFAELSPCAIDPLVRQVARRRLLQTAQLCIRYGISRMVVHSGFIPHIYFPEWFVEQSALFFRDLLAQLPASFQLLIENVLDPDPHPLLEMVDAIGDPRVGLCLDVGHAHASSSVPVEDWLDALAPRLWHLHIHDNDGTFDAHLPPGQGSIGFPGLFERIFSRAPRATVTCECPDATGCIRQLQAYGLLAAH